MHATNDGSCLCMATRVLKHQGLCPCTKWQFRISIIYIKSRQVLVRIFVRNGPGINSNCTSISTIIRISSSFFYFLVVSSDIGDGKAEANSRSSSSSQNIEDYDEPKRTENPHRKDQEKPCNPLFAFSSPRWDLRH